jgi:hypothetical protein
MSDGRQFTDYRPKCDVVFGGVPQPMTSYDYRMFLTNHAGDIIAKNREVATANSTCSWCDKSMAPVYATEQSCDDRICGFVRNSHDGIGMVNATTIGGEAPFNGPMYASI